MAFARYPETDKNFARDIIIANNRTAVAEAQQFSLDQETVYCVYSLVERFFMVFARRHRSTIALQPRRNLPTGLSERDSLFRRDLMLQRELRLRIHEAASQVFGSADSHNG